MVDPAGPPPITRTCGSCAIVNSRYYRTGREVRHRRSNGSGPWTQNHDSADGFVLLAPRRPYQRTHDHNWFCAWNSLPCVDAVQSEGGNLVRRRQIIIETDSRITRQDGVAGVEPLLGQQITGTT